MKEKTPNQMAINTGSTNHWRPPTRRFTLSRTLHALPLICAIALLLSLPAASLRAQSPPRVQQFTGVNTGDGDIGVYRLPGLAAGDHLFATMRTTSGDLDPILLLLEGDTDLAQTAGDYQREVERLVAANGDIAGDVALLRDSVSLAWDDDSGPGYAAALEFEVPASGDYILLAGASLGALGRITSGSYELWLGVNEPAVLSGEAVATEDVIAIADATALPQTTAVQETTGALTLTRPLTTFALTPIESEATLYIRVESTTDGFRPQVILRDFGGKPLEAGNLSQIEAEARLEYTLVEGGTGYTIEVGGAPLEDLQSDQTFRLLVGTGTPDVLTGTAVPHGNPLIQEPIQVHTGVRLNRMSAVDSQNENFTMIGSIRMDWVDPAYAFSPDVCNCIVKVYSDEDFRNFLADFNGRWPSFSIFNQLGPRSSQAKTIAIWSDGRARYVEEFSTTIQADFDFRKFPFDVERFPIFVDMLFANNYYVQDILPDYSAISPDHGEDEFVIGDFSTSVSTETGGSTGQPISRFTFEFFSPRHLDYYVFQIFVPILLIALISWFTFFLRDYTRRIEAAAANVLLFIAFSFSLAENYPRLGYLTFLDAIMLTTFVINTVVILYNVYLKQLESRGMSEKAEYIDHYLDWVYPVGYFVAILVVVWVFLLRS